MPPSDAKNKQSMRRISNIGSFRTNNTQPNSTDRTAVYRNRNYRNEGLLPSVSEAILVTHVDSTKTHHHHPSVNANRRRRGDIYIQHQNNLPVELERRS